MIEKNKQIKMARAQSGIKGKDLAKRLNISAAYLSQLENGMRVANDELFKRIIKETGVDANLLNFRDIHSLNETTSVPRWAEELCSDVSFCKSEMAKFRDQLADIHAFLVKLSAK